MYFQGLIIGVAAFLIIGIFHPIIIKGEYYFSDRIWPLFLAAGLLTVAFSCFIQNIVLSSVMAIFGCTCLWSIIELKEQRERVAKGWFPENPARAAKRANTTAKDISDI